MQVAVGALGVAQGISSMSAQSKQLAAQNAQVEASQKAADASAALRKTEIDTQRSYAQYQTRMNTLARQTQAMQVNLANQAQEHMARMQQSSQNFLADQQNIQQQLVGEQQRGEASRLTTGANQQASIAKGEAAATSAQNQAALANQTQAQRGQLSQGEQRRAMLQSILASSGGTPGRTEDALLAKDAGGDIGTALAQRLAAEGLSESDIKQLQYSQGIAEIARQLGVNVADYMRANADRADSYSNKLTQGIKQDINTTSQLDSANRQAALLQFQGAQSSDANADRVNEILAEYGLNAQQNASNIELSAQKSSLAAQQQALDSQKPNGLFNLLGSGLQAYSAFNQASGALAKPGREAYNSVQGGYNILSGQSLGGFDQGNDYQYSLGASLTPSDRFSSNILQAPGLGSYGY